MTEKILAILFVFIKSVVAATGYSGIALLMAIESACIPLPSELIMPFAGYLVYEGSMKLLWVATAGAIGCNLGSLVAYEIGYYGGRPLVEKYGRWILMGRRELDWADRFFLRWGYLAVLIARLLPVIRPGRRRRRGHGARSALRGDPHQQKEAVGPIRVRAAIRIQRPYFSAAGRRSSQFRKPPSDPVTDGSRGRHPQQFHRTFRTPGTWRRA